MLVVGGSLGGDVLNKRVGEGLGLVGEDGGGKKVGWLEFVKERVGERVEEFGGWGRHGLGNEGGGEQV